MSTSTTFLAHNRASSSFPGQLDKMSTAGAGVPPAAMNAVAVAVKGEVGGFSRGGNSSKRAVRWAAENLLHTADRFILVHVMPKITSIPTPGGDRISVDELDGDTVELYVEETKLKNEEVFVPYKRLCKSRKVETVVLEDDDPARALIRYVSDAEIKSLVLGSGSENLLMRKQRLSTVAEIVKRFAPETCDVHVISRSDIVNNSVSGTRNGSFSHKEHGNCSITSSKQISTTFSSSGESDVHDNSTASALAKVSFVNSQVYGYTDSPNRNSLDENKSRGSQEDVQIIREASSMSCHEQSDVQAEIELLRLELQDTVSMYGEVCEELVHARNKVQLLFSECLEENRKVNATLEREETLRKIASQQKAKHLAVLKDIEMAKCSLANEEYKRQIAELNALKEASEKQKVANALLLGDRRCRRYFKHEIEMATDNFSRSKVIGEGAYGKVYRCNLDHTPVAVKVLRTESHEKKEEFLKEVEILSQLRNPHMVLLVGACPEIGCLIYEYMENGSLEEYIYHQNGRPPLPWPIRFRIIFEVACGLAFLHNSKPEPIVHRDLKPGNILLGRNYVSKIGDVGLAKLISDVVPDGLTEYRDSVVAGTFYYMDPEYQRTGTIRPKSDLFAFGMIILQLLTGRHPKGLLLMVEEAISKGSFGNILDKTVRDWPVPETKELVQIGLNCLNLRCRDRPDLEAEVLPVLKGFAEFADASPRVGRDNAPSHFYCPILQEIMEDPYIAADGFTYEHMAIKAWLEKLKVSPVTKGKLPHAFIIPNQTLRSAIQDWRSQH
ncbi:hypothetical protein SAY87_007045 [Trapa incisa]|uniref:RING-type E3 ubiquitin transferase n=1 Tax=Trapa incisa TaxID=236973 RepID=A0AAN7Q067_9MYRT|nr:hypothetical protein SAY87_007045 [Trapa incisa]